MLLQLFKYQLDTGEHLTMSSNCFMCKEPCSIENVKCYGCQNVYHHHCSGIMESIYRKWTQDRIQQWRCTTVCKNQIMNQSASLQDLALKMSEQIQEMTKSLELQSIKHDQVLELLSKSEKKNRKSKRNALPTWRLKI